MYKQPEVYLLTLEMLKDETYFYENISTNMTNNYYWCDDWNAKLYIELAKKGFISTTYDTKGGLVLLPELQFYYAILDFKDLHISQKVKKLLNKNEFIFSKDTSLKEVLKLISSSHKHNWLKNEYEELLLKLYASKDERNDFNITSFELRCKVTKELIAGEVGYIIGKTYTSLSGFASRDKKYNNYGNLQLVLLARYLQDNQFSFWSLGHPHMEYKKKLGAKVYTREEFLKRWEGSVLLPTINPS